MNDRCPYCGGFLYDARRYVDVQTADPERFHCLNCGRNLVLPTILPPSERPRPHRREYKRREIVGYRV